MKWAKIDEIQKDGANGQLPKGVYIINGRKVMK